MLVLLQEHGKDIDAHQSPYEQAVAFGSRLVDEDHYEKANISAKLETLQAEWEAVNE